MAEPKSRLRELAEKGNDKSSLNDSFVPPASIGDGTYKDAAGEAAQMRSVPRPATPAPFVVQKV